MQLRPILSSLRHHKLTALLLMLQVAFTCAIVCNVIFMIVNRVDQVSLLTGLAEDELSVIHSTGIEKGGNPQALHAADLAALRAIPGVKSVVAASYSLPLDQSEWSTGVCPSKQALDRAMQVDSLDGLGCVEPSVYDGSPGMIATLGLHLVEGRDFLPDEYVATGTPPSVIVTRALAQHLYPGQQALGQSIYSGRGKPLRIVGILDTLLRPSLHKPGVNYDSMLYPLWPSEISAIYIMRSAQQDRQQVLKAAASALTATNANRIVEPAGMETYAQIRAKYFQRDITMIGLLLAAALGLLFVTALGIAGLANFWVQQRRRQIGIRRAIGATRGDILHYFQTENFLIVTLGIVLGMLLAYGLNLLLMTHYELPRLPLYYLPIGALALWLLGQLAVLGPALRAAAVPPVVATRSV